MTTNNNKEGIKAVLKIAAAAIISLLLFEYLPNIYHSIFGDIYEHEVQIISGVIAIIVLAIGGDMCKKSLDKIKKIDKGT